MNERYGRYTVLEVFTKKKFVGGKTQKEKTYKYAKCVCDCGSERILPLTTLTTGHSKSCGCLNREETAKRNYRHGYGKHPLKGVYYSMLRRCHNEKHSSYKNYGGRGITVCDEWRDDIGAFISWAENNGYEKGKQLDRIDNDKGYSPDNCRFVSVSTNLENRRTTIIIEGVSLKTFCESVSFETGIPAATIRSRFFRLRKRGIEPTRERIVHY